MVDSSTQICTALCCHSTERWADNCSFRSCCDRKNRQYYTVEWWHVVLSFMSLLFVTSDTLVAAVLLSPYSTCFLRPSTVPWRGGHRPIFPVEECDNALFIKLCKAGSTSISNTHTHTHIFNLNLVTQIQIIN